MARCINSYKLSISNIQSIHAKLVNYLKYPSTRNTHTCWDLRQYTARVSTKLNQVVSKCSAAPQSVAGNNDVFVCGIRIQSNRKNLYVIRESKTDERHSVRLNRTTDARRLQHSGARCGVSRILRAQRVPWSCVQVQDSALYHQTRTTSTAFIHPLQTPLA